MLKKLVRKLDPEQDAIDLLKADHRTIESLFAEYKAADKRGKGRLAKEICAELEIHSRIEESIFYRAAKKEAKPAGYEVNEGIVEHEGIKRLVKMIPDMSANDEFFEPRMDVLMEYVRHHVKEEESEMFPKIAESGLDLKDLGAKLARARQRLKSSPASKAA